MSSSSRTVKVAAVQAAPVFLDIKASVEKACDLIDVAGREGAKLVVFPEAFLSGYPDWVWVVPPGKGKALISELFSSLINNSIATGDEHTVRLTKVAKKAGVAVAIGVNERNTEASNATLYNSLLFIDASGEVLGCHRKLMPTGGERLMWGQGDGSTLEVHSSVAGRVGGLICWENFMPLARQALYSQGMQIHVAPTWDSSPTWQACMQTIAREGACFVVSCCQALHIDDIPADLEFRNMYPDGKEWINPGRSLICDPRGAVIAGPVEKSEEILYADLDMSLIPANKWLLDTAGHYARPDVFEFSVKSRKY